MEKPVKIQWEVIKDTENQTKKVFDPEYMPLAGKLVNKRFVTRNSKPWLIQTVDVRQRPTKETKERSRRILPEMDSKEFKIKGSKKPGGESVKYTKEQQSVTHKRGASLKELRPEDKKRVANLIKELAKAGEERELAVEQLQRERLEFQGKIDLLMKAQEQLLAERDLLHDKVLQQQLPVAIETRDKENEFQGKNKVSPSRKGVESSKRVTKEEDTQPEPERVLSERDMSKTSQSSESSEKPVKTYYYLTQVDEGMPVLVPAIPAGNVSEQPSDVIKGQSVTGEGRKGAQVLRPLNNSPSANAQYYRNIHKQSGVQAMLAQMTPEMQVQFLMQQTKLQEQQLKLQDQIHQLQEMQMNMIKSSQSDTSTLKSDISSLPDFKIAKQTETRDALREEKIVPQAKIDTTEDNTTGSSKQQLTASHSVGNAEKAIPDTIVSETVVSETLPLSVASGVTSFEQGVVATSIQSLSNSPPNSLTQMEQCKSSYENSNRSSLASVIGSGENKLDLGTQHLKGSYASYTSVENKVSDWDGREHDRDLRRMAAGSIMSEAEQINAYSGIATSISKSCTSSEVQRFLYQEHLREGHGTSMVEPSADVLLLLSSMGKENQKKERHEPKKQTVKIKTRSGTVKREKQALVKIPNLSDQRDASLMWRESDVSSIALSGNQQPRTSTRLDAILDLLNDVGKENTDVVDYLQKKDSKWIPSRGRHSVVSREVPTEEMEESTILEDVFFLQAGSHW